MDLRVGSRVRHGKEIWSVVPETEILIGEFLPVDGFAACTLFSQKSIVVPEMMLARQDA